MDAKEEMKISDLFERYNPEDENLSESTHQSKDISSSDTVALEELYDECGVEKDSTCDKQTPFKLIEEEDENIISNYCIENVNGKMLVNNVQPFSQISEEMVQLDSSDDILSECNLSKETNYHYVEPKNPFASGLPEWTLEPPNSPVVRKVSK